MRNVQDLRVASATCLAWAVLSSAGCAPDASSLGRQSTVLLERSDGAGGGGANESPLESPLGDAEDDTVSERLAAFDEEGALVLVDTTNGDTYARRQIGEVGAGVDPIDLVFDWVADRIVVVVKPPPFETSEIFEVPFDGEGLGPPRFLGRAVGDARVMPIEGGIVVASNEDGPRVRLMRDDGQRTRGRPLPEPLSWWSSEHGARIEGIGVDPDGRLVVFGLVTGQAGSGLDGSIEVGDREFVGTGSRDARLVRELRVTTASETRTAPAVLVHHDEASGAIRMTERPDGEARPLAFSARTLEGAVRWGGAIALTTRFPDSLVIADRDGESAVALAGGIRSGTPFGRHDLAVAAESLFVATAESVVSFRREKGDVSVAAADPAFAGGHLRGPLVAFER